MTDQDLVPPIVITEEWERQHLLTISIGDALFHLHPGVTCCPLIVGGGQLGFFAALHGG
jgi:hypothetical protein